VAFLDVCSFAIECLYYAVAETTPILQGKCKKVEQQSNAVQRLTSALK
jgi:hypothetical protein